MKTQAEFGYNERLFIGGVRGRLHLSRFHWLTQSMKKVSSYPKSVLELGCFDAKTIHYLPVKPERYVGFDANVEGGLDLARDLWKDEKNFEFFYCRTPDDMVLHESFDVSICMETLEHVPPELIDPYLGKLANHTKGYIFITVPNEKGIVFAVKYLVKRLFGDYKQYTLSEYVNATLGRMHKVRRKEHKGFDYDELIKSVATYFDIVEVSPFPFRQLPNSLGFGIAIIGRKCG